MYTFPISPISEAKIKKKVQKQQKQESIVELDFFGLKYEEDQKKKKEMTLGDSGQKEKCELLGRTDHLTNKSLISNNVEQSKSLNTL